MLPFSPDALEVCVSHHSRLSRLFIHSMLWCWLLVAGCGWRITDCGLREDFWEGFKKVFIFLSKDDTVLVHQSPNLQYNHSPACDLTTLQLAIRPLSALYIWKRLHTLDSLLKSLAEKDCLALFSNTSLPQMICVPFCASSFAPPSSRLSYSSLRQPSSCSLPSVPSA